MASVTPGTYGADCPLPTEIDCIVVDKVYDSCTQTVNITQNITNGPPCDMSDPPPKMCTVTACAIDLSSSTCTVGAITASSITDYSDVTFIIGIDYTITCENGETMPETAYTTQVVTLYNPTGTTPSCNILSGTCACVNLPTGVITCNLTVCVLFQTTAVVQLMVPTYGFCTPSVCPEVGPVLPCPPSPLYPPQLGS